jgi:hypothetical protein
VILSFVEQLFCFLLGVPLLLLCTEVIWLRRAKRSICLMWLVHRLLTFAVLIVIVNYGYKAHICHNNFLGLQLRKTCHYVAQVNCRERYNNVEGQFEVIAQELETVGMREVEWKVDQDVGNHCEQDCQTKSEVDFKLSRAQDHFESLRWRVYCVSKHSCLFIYLVSYLAQRPYKNKDRDYSADKNQRHLKQSE